MLTMADKGARGGLDPPFLADIICEQPLRTFGLVVGKSRIRLSFLRQKLAQ